MEIHSNQPAIRKEELWDINTKSVTRSSKYRKYRKQLISELPENLDYDPDKPIIAEIKLWDTETHSISEYLKAPIDVVSQAMHKSRCDKNVREIKITRIASNDKTFSISMNNIE